jgi:hypothetical protein
MVWTIEKYKLNRDFTTEYVTSKLLKAVLKLKYVCYINVHDTGVVLSHSIQIFFKFVIT